MPTHPQLQPTFADDAGAAPRSSASSACTPDRIQSHGLDLAKALGPQAPGWSGPRSRTATSIAEREADRRSRVRASLVQVTNLGITVKDSPQNTLVFVTRLDTGAPVAGAKVSIVNRDNSVLWTGTTGADGIAIGAGIARERRYPAKTTTRWQRSTFVVTRREGRRRRLRRQRLERRHRAVGLRRAVQPQRGGAAAARHGLHRSRRLPARRGGALQGDPPPEHADGIRLLPPGTPVFITRPRRPGPAGRRAHGRGQRLEQRRVDD